MKRIAVFMVCLLLFQMLSASVIYALAIDGGYAGEWVCMAVDPGSGTKQTQYEGQDVSGMFKIMFNQDGTLLVTSFGQGIPGTWTERAGGISAIIDGGQVEFDLDGSQLVNKTDGFLIYLEKAADKPKAGGLLSLVKGGRYVGRWVAVSVDMGNGVPVIEMDGVKVSELMVFQINRDGTLAMVSMGFPTPGTWYEIEGGIRADLGGLTTDLIYKDGQLVTTDPAGMTILFVREDVTATAAPPALTPVFEGVWTAVRYETGGNTYSASTLFPDGFTVTLLPDGTGKAKLTADYSETLTWSESNGTLALVGSFVLTNPYLDLEKDELQLTYASSVKVFLQRTDIENFVTEAPLVTAGPPTSVPTEAPTAVPTIAPTPVPTPVPAATPSEAPTEAPAVNTEMGADPGLCDMALFTMRFPEGWAINEGWSANRENYSNAVYELKDAGGSKLAAVTITASSEDVRTYREKIKSLLEKAEAAGRTQLDGTVIGGIAFTGTDYESWGWKYTEYAARVADARITLMVKIERPDNIADLQAIIDSISYKLPVLTPPNIDPPLPEDGAPYEPVTSSAMLGGKEITAEWVKTPKSIILDGMFDSRIALTGDTLYVLAGKMLYAYKLKGDSLTPAKVLEGGVLKLDDDYEFLSAAKDGTLFVSQGMFDILAVRNGAVVKKHNVSGDLVMHPSEDWGITYWVNADPKVVRVVGDELVPEPWVLSGLSNAANRQGRFSSISCLAITGNRIFVAGTDEKSGGAHRCAAFGLKGKELYTFGGTDWKADDALGSVTGIAETKSGILVQDGNLRDFKLFSKTGEFLGKVNCDGLLGTNYPWLSSLIATKNGVLIAAAQERADKSCYELLIFRIKGL